MTVRQEIIDACAWMLWANAWVSLQEDEDREVADRQNPGAGGSWDPLVPDVPEAIRATAADLIASIERLNGATVDVLYARAIALPGKRYTKREPTPERFGNCLAYQTIGAGVSWADDYPDPKIKISYMEVVADSDTEAYTSGPVERLAR